MRPLTLRNGLVLIVVAALIPIGILSVVQALSALRYTHTLIGNQLVMNAIATAGFQHDPLILSKQVMLALSANPAVRAGDAGCHDALSTGLGDHNPALLNMARSDSAGHVQCSILPFDPSTSFANETWWQRGIKTQEFTVSAVVIGQISKKRILIAMEPLRTAEGNNIGAITAAIDASWLEKSMAQSSNAQDAIVAIIDEKGKVVLTNDKRPLPLFDIHAGSTQVASAASRNGVDWMYAVAPLYASELYVVYAEPTDQLMAAALKQVRISLILPIVALLLASLAIWIGTNRLVLRWLESLRVLAAQFAQGNFAGDPEKYRSAPSEIALLSTDLHRMAYAIEARDKELLTALEAKTALTHDIHHRVKNNLQIVSSLLNLQASKISDPAARAALGQTRARIGALAQIHRLLYEESQDSDHGNVNIAHLLNALCSQLRALYRGQNDVHLSCEVASQTVPINNAVPLTLLAVEATTNAYRHGFAAGQGGTIILHFKVTDNVATLSVRDDGMGFDPMRETSSMGRQLMDAFAQQLDGILEIASSPGNGTVVKLTYALSQPHDHAVLLPDA